MISNKTKANTPYTFNAERFVFCQVFSKPGDKDIHTATIKKIRRLPKMIKNGISFNQLEKFRGVPVQEFYSKVVCGGTLMELRNNGKVVEHVEAPLAFQSAMAGILELAEVVIKRAALRQKALPTKTQFYPLSLVKSGSNPYNHSFTKDATGRCICADIDFIEAYTSKWSTQILA